MRILLSLLYCIKFWWSQRKLFMDMNLQLYHYPFPPTIVCTVGPLCHFNVKSVQINEFVQLRELSDKIHYLAS